MKRHSTSQNKSKSRSVVRSASIGLIEFVKQKHERTIPVAFITAAHKLYARGKALEKEDRFVKRFSDKKGLIDTNRFVEYLGKGELQERGKGLSEESMKRVYENCCNQDGKLTFEYIMKMGDNCGITINMRVAKAIVRKYGGRKDHLNLQDCSQINKRRVESSLSARRR